MGHLTALAAARKGAEVVVTSRTGERAAALAREVGGWAIPFGGGGVVPKVSGAIVAPAGVLAARWSSRVVLQAILCLSPTLVLVDCAACAAAFHG